MALLLFLPLLFLSSILDSAVAIRFRGRRGFHFPMRLFRRGGGQQCNDDDQDCLAQATTGAVMAVILIVLLMFAGCYFLRKEYLKQQRRDQDQSTYNDYVEMNTQPSRTKQNNKTKNLFGSYLQAPHNSKQKKKKPMVVIQGQYV